MKKVVVEREPWPCGREGYNSNSAESKIFLSQLEKQLPRGGATNLLTGHLILDPKFPRKPLL